MTEREQPSPEEMGVPPEEQIETTQVGEVVYDIDKLRSHAETLPDETVDIEEVIEAVGEGHQYWVDKNGEMFGPHEILQDWEAAQENPLWEDHVATIKRADTNKAIWRSADGAIFDGMHRLTRAVLDGKKEIPLKQFGNLPEEAVVRDEEK